MNCSFSYPIIYTLCPTCVKGIIPFSIVLPVTLRGKKGIHDIIQSISGIGTLSIAIMGGLFVVEEIEDRRKARIAAAWNLLNSSRFLAENDFLRMIESPELRVIRLISNDGRCRAQRMAGSLADSDEAPSDSDYCDFRNEYGDLRVDTKSRLLDELIEIAMKQSFGQRSALETLASENIPTPGLILSGYNLDGAQLSGAMLMNSSFFRANLRGADLSNADLTGSDFLDADIEGAKFDQTKLAGASMAGATLVDAELSGQDLSSIDLSGAWISKGDFSQIDASGNSSTGRSDFSGAWIANSTFEGAILSGFDFGGARISNSTLRKAILTCTVLTNANFKNVDLFGADIGCATVS
jgi:uncharacterized protein YjbI with pentapeptide repeats